MTSVSETAVQDYFNPIWQVHLARQLRLAWFYFDPLGTFAPLAGLLRLISCPTTISSHNHYYCSTTSLGPAARFGNFHPLVRFAPFGPCPVLGNLLRLLVIFVGRNTVPAVLRTLYFLPRFACTASCSLLAPRLLPCSHRAVVLACTVPRVRQLGLAIFLRSSVSLRLTPALRSSTSSNGSLSYSLEGIRYLQCSALAVSYLVCWHCVLLLACTTSASFLVSS